MELYTRIAAVNVCISRSVGLEFDKAVFVAGETVTQVIQGQHEGRIAKVGAKTLTMEELRQGAVTSAVLAAVQVCPDAVPSEVKAKVEALIKGVNTGAEGNRRATPAAPVARPAATPGAAPAAKPAAKP
jgi:hypothetical protein